MDSINKHIGFPMTMLLVLLCSCNGFENKLCEYMKRDQPNCPDTTYWQTIDLQKVLNIEYDRLYLLAPNFEEDIRQITHSNWNDGDFVSWDENLLLLIKGNNVVYKEAVDNCYKVVEFDQPDEVFIFDSTTISNDCLNPGILLLDTTSIYNVKICISNSEIHYYLYNKERLDKGEMFRNPS